VRRGTVLAGRAIRCNAARPAVRPSSSVASTARSIWIGKSSDCGRIAQVSRTAEHRRGTVPGLAHCSTRARANPRVGPGGTSSAEQESHQRLLEDPERAAFN
jgi:hypothetical protein